MSNFGRRKWKCCDIIWCEAQWAQPISGHNWKWIKSEESFYWKKCKCLCCAIKMDCMRVWMAQNLHAYRPANIFKHSNMHTNNWKYPSIENNSVAPHTNGAAMQISANSNFTKNGLNEWIKKRLTLARAVDAKIQPVSWINKRMKMQSDENKPNTLHMCVIAMYRHFMPATRRKFHVIFFLCGICVPFVLNYIHPNG